LERENREVEALVTAIPPAELIDKLREYYVEMARDENHCAFWLGLQLHSIRNEAIRPRMAELMRKKREHVIAQVRRVYAAIGKETPGSAETVALGLITIAQGLSITRALDPEAIAGDLLPRALETLFNQITGTA
jgi:hypothetical protein